MSASKRKSIVRYGCSQSPITPRRLKSRALYRRSVRRRIRGTSARNGSASSFTPTLPCFFSTASLDRQAVAIPARHVGRIEAGHQLRLDDDVLEDLVDRMADVDRRHWRTAGHRAARTAGGPWPCARSCAYRPSASQRASVSRLALGQVAAHREIRRGQVEGGFVVRGSRGQAVVAVESVERRSARLVAASRCICSVSDGRSGNFSSSRSLATNSTSMRRPYRSPSKSNRCASSKRLDAVDRRPRAEARHRGDAAHRPRRAPRSR